MHNFFIICTPKMMNSPRRSDASWTALSSLRGWIVTFVSWPYMRLWIFTCILWFDCPHPIYAPLKKLLWIKCKSWILNESWICALLSSSRNFSKSSFSKFYMVHKKCFTCAKLIISWRNQGCLAASTFIRVAKGLPNVLIIKAPSFANGNIILLCPYGSVLLLLLLLLLFLFVCLISPPSPSPFATSLIPPNIIPHQKSSLQRLSHQKLFLLLGLFQASQILQNLAP